MKSFRGAFFVLAALVVVGCGTAEYETKLDQAVRRLRIENKFVGIDVKETLIAAIKNEQGTGAKISIRKPSYFGGPAFTEGAADPRQPSQPLKPERVKPPQLTNFPGFQFSYEQKSQTRGFGIAYLYFGAQPADSGAADRVLADLQAANAANPAAAPENAPQTWVTVQADTPDGGSTPWKMISLTGSNVFWIEGNPQADHLAGTFIVWMREQQGFQVFVGLRVSTMGVDLEPLKKLVTASLGTVRVVTPVKIE
jgi:hypothetical protein